MKKALYFAAAASAALVAGSAQAAVLTGGFTITSFGGEYVGGQQTALTATGLDFGSVIGGAGNGYGNNGSATVGEATGSFLLYNGTVASVADISLGSLANPYNTNPFLTLTGLFGTITMSFNNANVYRSPVGVTIEGAASFVNGGDTTNGTFGLTTLTDRGGQNTVRLSFQSSASTSAVPEPATWGMMIVGFGLMGGVLRRRSTKVAFA